jgi:cob(I)alamin adenosyltransferase
MRIEVAPDALRGAARDIERIRAAVERLGVARQLDAAAAAVPGGRLAAAATDVADAWCRERGRLVAGLAGYSGQLERSAGTYADADAAAAQAGVP